MAQWYTVREAFQIIKKKTTNHDVQKFLDYIEDKVTRIEIDIQSVSFSIGADWNVTIDHKRLTWPNDTAYCSNTKEKKQKDSTIGKPPLWKAVDKLSGEIYTSVRKIQTVYNERITELEDCIDKLKP